MYRKEQIGEKKWLEIQQALNDYWMNLLSFYSKWTKEELINKINQLEVENQELRNNNGDTTMTDSERQAMIKNNERITEVLKNNFSIQETNPNNNFPTGWIVGTGIMLVLGLVGILFIRKLGNRNRVSR